jgi:hypothetical protein
MKKFFKLAAVAALAITATVACKKDGDDPTTTPSVKPSISLGNDGTGFITGDVAVEINSSLMFRIVANENSETNKNLERITVSRGGSDDVLDTIFNSKTFTFDLTTDMVGANSGIALMANATAGDEIWVFEATDKSGEKSSISLTITTTNSNPLLTEDATGVLSNINGGNNCLGAFDLLTSEGKSSTTDAALKDMINATNGDFTGYFSASNGTMFTVGTLSDYDNATASSLVSAYAAVSGSASAFVNAPQAGNVYLVKLRDLTRYAIIKITSVDADYVCDASASATGQMTFSYKITQ